MSGWASVITNVGELAEDSVSGRGCVQKAGPAIAGFEDGGKGVSRPQMRAASGDWKRQENRLSPGASRKELDPTDSWILAQGDLCISDLQNCKTINVCYFKPLSFLTFRSSSSRTLLVVL